MDHPLPAPDALVRPWRTAAYAAGAVAAVELLLLLLIGGGKVAALVSDRVQVAARDRVLAGPVVRAQPAAKHRATVAPAHRPRSKTTVMVLNGNGRTGAAAAAASRVRAHGYRIGRVGNAPKVAPRTIVMYRPRFAGEGRRLAKDLGVRMVGPLDGMRASGLGRSQVVLILGA